MQDTDALRRGAGTVRPEGRPPWRVQAVVGRLGPLLGLVLLAAVLSVLTPRFLDSNNLANVARQVSINAVIAAGMTIVILTGGIDLSVGSVLALSGAATAGLATGGAPLAVAVPAGLGLGLLLGVANGLLVTYGRIPPFIATLGTMTAARGLTLVYTGGRPITGLSDSFRVLGTGSMPTFIMLLVYLAAWAFLSHTRPGRYIYAIGSNEEAARVAGIPVHRYKILAYALAGLVAGLAGVVLTARLNSAQPTAGVGFELDAIAAVVLGGTRLSGGTGSVGGTLVGSLIIGVLNNGLNLLDVSSFYQQVVKGVVILLAVLVDRGKR